MNRPFIPVAGLALALIPIAAVAQDASARTVQYHSQDIVPIHAKLKYTTLIEVPATEKIMEAATGDKDFWVVDVVGNFCFVHPAKAGISSNLNLITDKGNIYSFTLQDVSSTTETPDLKVIVEPADRSSIVAASGPPQFVPAAQLEQSKQQLAAVESHVAQAVDEYKSAYPLSMKFDYNFHANEAPFDIEAIYHDDKFTYIKTSAPETTVLANVRSAVEAQGYDVQGFAPTSRAARQLREAGIEAGTLQGFLARSAPSDVAPERRHFYFVDESSLASTNQMREFLARLGRNDRALLIGDTRQHQGVEAGRPFEQLQEAGMRTAKLDEIVRQKDPALKSAVELLATGQATAAVALLHQQGRIREIVDPQERIRTIARAYAESPANTLIVSPDNASRRELNLAVRQELKSNGVVGADDHSFRVLVQHQDMTGADRAWANHYDPGDVVRYARGSKNIGIEAGSYGTVAAINPSANLLTVEMQSGELATYDPRRLTGVSVYREVAHEFSVGDRIQFTAPDKALGVANRDLAVIESIAPDGRIAAHSDDNQLIEFNAAEHRHFDHGYAVTSHSAQGLTAERVLIHADTSVHPDLLNSRFGYVSVSRASGEATIFTNDTGKLGLQLGSEISKTSALEVSQSASIGQNIEHWIG